MCVCYLHTDRWWYIEGVFVTFKLTGNGILRVVCYLHTDRWWYFEGVFVTFTLTGGGILRVCLLPSH